MVLFTSLKQYYPWIHLKFASFLHFGWHYQEKFQVQVSDHLIFWHSTKQDCKICFKYADNDLNNLCKPKI